MTALSPLLERSLAFLYRCPSASIDEFWRMTGEEIDDPVKALRQYLVVSDLLNNGYVAIRLTTSGRAVASAGAPASDDLRQSSVRALVYMSKHPNASIGEIRTAAAVLGYERMAEAITLGEMLSGEYAEMRLTSKGRRAGRRAARKRR